MEFTPEQFEVIENLAGINYNIKQVAMYFDVSPQLLHNEYADKEWNLHTITIEEG